VSNESISVNCVRIPVHNTAYRKTPMAS